MRCVDCLQDISATEPRYDAKRQEGKFIALGHGEKLCMGCAWGSRIREEFVLMVPERHETSKGEVFYVDTYPTQLPSQHVQRMFARASRRESKEQMNNG